MCVEYSLDLLKLIFSVEKVKAVFLSFSLLRFVALLHAFLIFQNIQKIGDSSENLQRKTKKLCKENWLVLVINVQIKMINSSALRLTWAVVVYYGSNL